MANAETTHNNSNQEGETRRDFLQLATTAMVGVGGALCVWPIINSMNPAADTLALSSIKVDLTSIELGQAIKVMWRGKPVFIRHRTAENIAEAKAVPMDDLKDPQTDLERTTDANGIEAPEWLIMVGICTHLGCIPEGTGENEERGDYDGWFCPCHGSQYDSSGRIRKGPAPLNLEIPEYAFTDDSKSQIIIG